MACVSLSTIGATPYEKVIGHAPHILEPRARLEAAFLARSIPPPELVELVAFMSFMWAGGAFVHVLGIRPASHYQGAAGSRAHDAA